MTLRIEGRPAPTDLEVTLSRAVRELDARLTVASDALVAIRKELDVWDGLSSLSDDARAIIDSINKHMTPDLNEDIDPYEDKI